VTGDSCNQADVARQQAEYLRESMLLINGISISHSSRRGLNVSWLDTDAVDVLLILVIRGGWVDCVAASSD
jgi:hypothetical protein